MTTRQEKRHPSPKELELLLPLPQHIKNIILKSEELYVEALMKEWVFSREVITPTSMGRQKAEENLALYQKQKRYLSENVELMKLFAKEKHDIQL